MKAMKFTVAFPDGAAVHRVVQALRTLHSDAGIAERPEIVVVAGDGADAEGIARQLRQLGVNIAVHESLEVAAVEAFDRAALPSRPAVLLGSDTYPAYIEINGENVQLGTLVGKAHELSGMSVSTWNALSTEQRDDYIEAAISAYQMQDPTAPVHDITGAEFAAAMAQKQDQAKAEQAAAEFSARVKAEHADVLGEQEKGEETETRRQITEEHAAALLKAQEKQPYGFNFDGEANPAQNQAGTAEQAGDIAPGHHWETRPDGTQTLRADDAPAGDGAAADDGQASTTTDGSASE